MLTPLLRADLATPVVGGTGQGGRDDVRQAVELLRQAVSVPEDYPLHNDIRRRLAAVLMAAAAAEPTSDGIAEAQRVVDQVLAKASEVGPAQQGADLVLRSMLAILQSTPGDPHRAKAGVAGRIEAIRTLPADHDMRAIAVSLVGGILADRHLVRTLADAHRAAGQDELARRTGFAAVEEQAGLVLLKTGMGHAVLTARGAAADAATLAEWCLADEEPDAALHAIELGRGLAVHATTSTLEVLRSTPAGTRLFSVPSTTDIVDELVAHNIDALVYLVPGTGHRPGRPLGIGRNGRPITDDLPDLVIRPDSRPTRFIAADQDEPARWKAALEELCDWPGEAVLGTLLDAVGRGRRVVLVPLVRLGAVSWPAARIGGLWFGCTELVLSTAASARQFLDSLRRPPRRSTTHRSW